MPELPEVETIRRSLARSIVGQRINQVRVKKGSRLLRDTVSAPALRRGLVGKRIGAVGRRGKYLLLALDANEFLVVHLGMTGCLFTLDPGGPRPPHQHLRLSLDDCDLVLVDPRTFGRIFLVPGGGLPEHPVLSRLGPEPLDRGFTVARFADRLAGRRTPLKAALLDQAVVAGIGNIYADEACFGAGISPLRSAGELSRDEVKKLHASLCDVLRRSIAMKGTTIRDYQWAAGKKGNFVAMLQAYGREGRTCSRCGNRITRRRVAGRSTFFCPGCQPR